MLSFWEQFANKRSDVCSALSVANSNSGGGSSQAAPGLGLMRKKSLSGKCVSAVICPHRRTCVSAVEWCYVERM